MVSGFALLPSLDFQLRFIELQARLSGFVSGPVLGVDSCLPHLTVLQCPFNISGLSLGVVESIVERSSVASSLDLKFSGFSYQPNNWLFADFKSSSSLVSLHESSLVNASCFIDSSLIDASRDMSGYSLAERDYFLKYGYRYVKECFRPHVTLGRVSSSFSECLPFFLDDYFFDVFSSDVVVFDRFVSYEAGVFGSLSRVVSCVSL